MYFQFYSNYFQDSVIWYIPMIVSGKSHRNLSDYIQFLLKKKIEFDRKRDYF